MKWLLDHTIKWRTKQVKRFNLAICVKKKYKKKKKSESFNFPLTLFELKTVGGVTFVSLTTRVTDAHALVAVNYSCVWVFNTVLFTFIVN